MSAAEPNHEERLFTLELARAALPLVQRIVGDLVTLHPQWRDAVSAFELEQDGATADGESDAAREARETAGRIAGEIESCLDELGQVGCLFKGFETGLIDFPTIHDGRVVYLCWQFGETDITHWHEVDDGFAGRTPLEGGFIGAES